MPSMVKKQWQLGVLKFSSYDFPRLSNVKPKFFVRYFASKTLWVGAGLSVGLSASDNCGLVATQFKRYFLVTVLHDQPRRCVVFHIREMRLPSGINIPPRHDTVSKPHLFAIATLLSVSRCRPSPSDARCPPMTCRLSTLITRSFRRVLSTWPYKHAMLKSLRTTFS